MQKLCNVVGEPAEYSDFRNNLRIFNDHLAQSDKYRTLLQLVHDHVQQIPFKEVRFRLRAGFTGIHVAPQDPDPYESMWIWILNKRSQKFFRDFDRPAGNRIFTAPYEFHICDERYDTGTKNFSGDLSRISSQDI